MTLFGGFLGGLAWSCHLVVVTSKRVLGTWVLGTWYLALGTWYLALGTCRLVLGTWNLVLGTLTLGTCWLAPDTCYFVQLASPTVIDTTSSIVVKPAVTLRAPSSRMVLIPSDLPLSRSRA